MAGPAETGSLFLFDEPQAGTPRRSQEIRNNFEALARTNIGSDPSLPAAPREGMQRFLKDDVSGNWKLQAYLAGEWQTILQRVNLQLPAAAKVIFQFVSVASPWVLQHDLGSQPLVQIYDLSWIQRQAVHSGPGAGQYILQHADVNRTNVTFSAPATGFAIVLG